MKAFSILFVALLVSTSCSTTSSRIKKNQKLFDSYETEVQEKIRASEIDLGFTKAMVTIALGKPDRERTRRTLNGEVDMWVWVDYTANFERQLVRGNFHFRDDTGNLRRTSNNIWVDVQNKVEFDKLRLEFDSEGKVTAIESLDDV